MKTNIRIIIAFILFSASLISSCKKDEDEISPKDIEYSENLLIVDSTELLTITSFNDQGQITLPSGTSLAGKLHTGMIIAGGISNITPYGFLKKVTGVNINGSNAIFTTENATFEDAFVNASVNFSKQLSVNDISESNNYLNGISVKSSNGEGFFIKADDVVLWDGDGNPSTTGDQIKADGSIFIDPTMNFSFDIHNGKLGKFYFSVKNVQSSKLTIFVGSEVFSRECDYSLVRITMNPIYIQAGLVPIVAVPVLEINLGAKVEVNLRVEAEVTQSAELEYGVQYVNGLWEPISHSELSLTYEPPQLSASVEVKGYFGPQLNLLLYGIAGPYTNANIFLKLDADILDTPWWTLYGGGEIGVGVQVDFLGNTLADIYLPNVLNYQQIIAQANGGTEGTIKGTVKDAVSQYGLSNVQVKVKKGNQDFGTAISETDGQFHISSPVGDGIIVEFTKEGYLPVVYQNISVSINEDTYLEPVLQIDNSHGGIGNIAGYIYNALDGTGIQNCNLSLRSGINATEGLVLVSSITNNDGSYALQGLSAGHYTIQAQRQGFTDSFFTVVCIGGDTYTNQNGTMTPILNEDEIRIILTWGSNPSDLDSHLTGPAENGNRFHVCYYSKTYYQNGQLYAALDYDDVSSYGPETLSIYQLSEGLYRYSVHDYTNHNQSSSYELSNSSAQVRVYQGNNLISNFNVPTNTGGTLWTVFEMSNGHINPVNSMTYESSAGAVTSPGNNNDLNLMKNLPAKSIKSN